MALQILETGLLKRGIPGSSQEANFGQMVRSCLNPGVLSFRQSCERFFPESSAEITANCGTEYFKSSVKNMHGNSA